MAVLGGIPAADIEAIVQAQLTNALAPIQQRLGQVEQQLGTLIQQLHGKADVQAFAQHQATLSQATQTFTQLQASIQTVQNQVTQNSTQLPQLQASIQDVQTQVTQNSTQLPQLQANIQNVQNQVTQNTTQLPQLQARIQDVHNQVTQNSTQLQASIQSVQAATKSAIMNKATAAFGARLHSGSEAPLNGGHLLCGGAHSFNGGCGFAYSTYPDPVEVQWNSPVSLAYVNFRLWDQDDRTCTYSFEFQGTDGVWNTVCDQMQGKSWQRFALSGNFQQGVTTMVRALKWSGTNTSNNQLHLVEIEAV